MAELTLILQQSDDSQIDVLLGQFVATPANVVGYANAAAASASSAALSASNASNSAGSATTAASNASTSASNAATSATNATTSATNAAASAATATAMASLTTNPLKEIFNAGTDFNAGQASITLANSYGSIDNIDIYADGYPQLDCSLTNKNLTFNGGAPNVAQIIVRGRRALAAGVPSDGVVTDSKVSPASKLWNRIQTINVKDPAYGARGDATTDDTTAINLAQAAGSAYVPTGFYKTTINSASLTGPFSGLGQIQDSSGNKRGKIFNAISSRPTTSTDAFNIGTAFNGDLTKQPFTIEHRVTGSGTLGSPTVGGYITTPETAAYNAWLFNTSGAVSGNGPGAGRTAAMLHFVAVQQYGQADAHAYNVNAFIGSNNPSATDINAAPAACLFTGQVGAGVDGCYLNPMELNCVDNGHDVAGAGYVSNSFRTNATGALGAWWYGFRQQSVGSVPVDVAFSATGKHKFGLDLSYCDFGTNNSAITLKADQKIYGNVTAIDPTGRYPTVSGDFFSYSSASSGWVFAAGGTPALIITSAQVSSPVPISSANSFKINNNQVVSGRIGGYGSPTGASKIANFPGATATLMQTSQMLAALIADLETHGLIGT